jgi:hypothetical protein
MDVRDVLNRRTDLSTFLVHLTRELGDGYTAKQRLISIIVERKLRPSVKPFGWAPTVMGASGSQAVPDDQLGSQHVVCFSETPLEHTYSLVAPIDGRQIRLEPYGVGLTKMLGRRLGVNPVWYVDMTPGRDWTMSKAMNELVRAAGVGFATDPVRHLTPFVEMMGTWGSGSQKEFWWEREWRHVGELDLWPIRDKVLWLCPENEIPEMEQVVRDQWAIPDRDPIHCIDPRWGLEQIIGALMGLPAGDRVHQRHTMIQAGDVV